MIIDASFKSTPCFPPTRVYLLGELTSLLWWRIPIHPCLWSANNCPTLSNPTVTHSSGYIIYTDDISNSSRPRLEQACSIAATNQSRSACLTVANQSWSVLQTLKPHHVRLSQHVAQQSWSAYLQ